MFPVSQSGALHMSECLLSSDGKPSIGNLSAVIISAIDVDPPDFLVEYTWNSLAELCTQPGSTVVEFILDCIGEHLGPAVDNHIEIPDSDDCETHKLHLK